MRKNRILIEYMSLLKRKSNTDAVKLKSIDRENNF